MMRVEVERSCTNRIALDSQMILLFKPLSENNFWKRIDKVAKVYEKEANVSVIGIDCFKGIKM